MAVAEFGTIGDRSLLVNKSNEFFRAKPVGVVGLTVVIDEKAVDDNDDEADNDENEDDDENDTVVDVDIDEHFPPLDVFTDVGIVLRPPVGINRFC